MAERKLAFTFAARLYNIGLVSIGRAIHPADCHLDLFRASLFVRSFTSSNVYLNDFAPFRKSRNSVGGWAAGLAVPGNVDILAGV